MTALTVIVDCITQEKSHAIIFAMMQVYSFTPGYSSQSESASATEMSREMHTLENRRHYQPDTMQNDEIVEMEDAGVKSSNVDSKDYDYFSGSLSPKLQVDGSNETGYNSLPSLRQSLARSRHHKREDNEGTPLLSHQHSHHYSNKLDVGDDNEDNILELTSARKRRHAFKKYGIQIKIAILFAIMLASVVSIPSHGQTIFN